MFCTIKVKFNTIMIHTLYKIRGTILITCILISLIFADLLGRGWRCSKCCKYMKVNVISYVRWLIYVPTYSNFVHNVFTWSVYCKSSTVINNIITESMSKHHQTGRWPIAFHIGSTASQNILFVFDTALFSVSAGSHPCVRARTVSKWPSIFWCRLIHRYIKARWTRFWYISTSY